jgi:chromosome segregation ATPase
MTDDMEHLGSVFRLLMVLADPKAALDRLAELRSEYEELKESSANNEKLLRTIGTQIDEVARRDTEAERVMADAERWNLQLEAKEKELKQKAGDLADFERAVNAEKDNLRHRLSKMDERESTLSHREDALRTRAEQVEAKLAEVKALLASYDEAKHQAALKLAAA